MHKHPTEHYDYIDGLRAIAVLSVLVFHMDSSVLAGGGAGVDVFFVISGFVVSAALARIEARSLASLLLQFYARRMRRILPALLLMLVVTQALVVLFVPQVYLSRFIDDTAIAASLGWANIFLAGHTDYFSPSAAFNPFVHTWSLGVEEQFYVLFPFLFFLLRHGWGRQVAVIGFLCVASLLWGWMNAPAHDGQAFYSSPGRFWEIGLGIFLQLFLTRWQPAMSQQTKPEIWSLTLAGVVGILLSFFVSDAASFPVPGALLPVMATGLFIIGIHDREIRYPWSAALLLRPVSFIGTLSYSLYLWHWPVFVLARWTFGFSTPLQKGAALALVIGLSVSSYLYVERPLRTAEFFRRPWRTLPVGLAAMATSVAFIFASNLAASQASLVQAVRQDKTWFPYDLLTDDTGCAGSKQELNRSGADVTLLLNTCQKPAGKGTIFVIGDSHAGAYTRMLDHVSRRTGMRIEIYETVGCSVLTLKSPSEDCRTRTAKAIADVLQLAQPGDSVFLPSLRIPRFVDESDESIADAQGIMDGWNTGSDNAVALGRALLTPLSSKPIRIIFELPKPVLKYAPFRCADWFNHMNPACAMAGPVSRSEIEKLRAPVISYARRLADVQSNITFWDPLPQLCDEKLCFDYIGGQPLYYDGDHLTGAANEMLADSFVVVLPASK